jgi:peroxidase
VLSPAENLAIPVSTCDPQGNGRRGPFDPRCLGNRTLPFQRASWSLVDNVRQQINANSSFIDASVIYGSDNIRAHALRTLDGTGHLATSTGNLMPFNTGMLINQPERGNPPDYFLGGDVRANENSALCAMQTLWVREHNFWADSFAGQGLDDDGIYLRARAIVGAEIQLITYRDFLPILLGPNALTTYGGYNEAVDPRISVAFSAAAFRLGHTYLPSALMRLNKRGITIGDLALGKSIFAPNMITGVGIEPYLRGLAAQQPQEVDAYIITDIRSFVIQGTNGFDLVALDIQRGRDMGLPSYNQTRIDYGLAPKASFAEMTSDMTVQTLLSQAYTSPDDLDVFIGGLVEDHVNGGQVGELFWTIIKEQFQRSRDGDRFWYESYLDATTLATVQAQTLGAIIKRNCFIGSEMQDEVFHIPTAH